VLIGISALFRITIAVAFPSVLRKVAGAYDLNAEYERMDMYLLDGDVGLSHLKITPKAGGESIIDLEYCRGDVSALNLLRGKLVVRRAEVDGVDMHVEREPDGTIPLLKRFVAPEIKRTEARELTIDPPLRIDALRLNRVRAKWRDKSVQPAIETVADLTMRLSDLGSPTRATKFLLDITSPPLLDSVRIEGEGNAGVGQPLDAKLSVVVRGIHPKPAQGYLLPLGLKPVADDISVACTGAIKARTLVPGTTTRPTVLAGDITLENVFVKADGREAAGIDRVVVKVDSANGLVAQLSSVLVDGVRASAERTAAGNVRVAGMELVAAAPAATATPATAAPVTGPALAATLPAEPPLRVELAELTIKNVRASFADAAVTPVANPVFLVNTLTARGLSSKPDQIVQIAGEFAAPGIAKAIQLNGTAKPFAAVRTFDAKLAMTGLRPDALKGYLDAVGVESTMKDAAATCDLSASLATTVSGRLDASLVAQNIRVKDGAELLAFDVARVNSASIDPTDGRIRVEVIELTGPRLNVERSADGTVHTLGLRTKPATTAPVMPKPATTVAQASAVPSTAPVVAVTMPKVEIGRFTWKGVGIQVRDQAVSPPTTMAITDAGVEMTDVRVGIDPGPTTQPGRIRAWLVAPGLVKQFAVTGTIAPIADGADATIDIAATGLNADLLAPYLKAMGIEPTLKDGTFACRTRATVQGSPKVPVRASVAVDNLRYEDQKKELIGVTGLAVKSIELRPDGVAVSTVQVNQPRIRVERDADGALHLAGIKLAAATTRPATPASATSPITVATSQPAQPLVATLEQLRVSGASLTWIDRAMMPVVNAAARADVELDRFVFGKPGEPAKLKITAKIDQMLDSFVAAGLISADPNAPRAQLDLCASGIRNGDLAAYLPSGTKITLQDGRFHGKLDAAAPIHPGGGRSVKVVLTDFDYRDNGAQQAFIRFDNANVSASRIDPPGGVVAIDEVSLRGLETEVRQAADGSTKLLGLTIAAASPPQTSGATNGTGHVPLAPKSPPPATGPSDVKALLAQQQQKLPLVTLDKLDVQLKRVAYVDESKPDAKSLALADVKLRNAKRIELLGPEATQRPPVELEIVGRIDPIVGNFNVAIQSAPHAVPATLNVRIAADQIRGEGVTELLPDLREQVDGAALTDGRFTANIEAQAKIEHRSAGALDFTRPVEGSVLVRNVEYRSAADSPVLAGVEEIRAEPVRVDTQTGAVSIRTLEITKPIARATREKDGIHVMGLLIRPAPAATQPAPADKPAEQPTLPPQPEATLASNTTAPPPEKPTAEIKIDKLLISGIDFHAEDRSVDPPLVVPINSLELEVRDLSNMAMFENRPIRFNLTTGAGKIPLKDGKDRELFSEVTAAGNIALYPELRGWARSSVSGLEMTALAGVAKEQNVTIESGVFDSNVDVRIADDVLNTRSKFAFTDLRMSEESDGPIGRVLKLPGSLDTMIIVLQDPSGAITVPLNVKVKEYAVGGEQIAGAAVTALSSIFATAMASAPLKVTSSVTSVVGLDKAFGKKSKDAGPQEAGAIAFAPGVSDPTDGRLIDEMARRLRGDKNLELTLRHQLGSRDLSLATERANPPADVCLAMTQQLRQRKAELTATRARLASESRAILLARSDAFDPAAELRGVDRELASTEQALDRLYDLLRPGAERQADRRTRAACIELADERLATIRQALTTAGIANIDDRVKVIRSPAAEADAGQGGKVVLTTAFKKKV
jgi:hypothetical protein